MSPVTTLGFDADDTLWQNEQFYRFTEKRFTDLLADHGAHEEISARLLEAERRNLNFYGFGIKGFTLSMIETAIEVTGGKASPAVIKAILDCGREMLHHPVELLPDVAETLAALAPHYRLVLITKGDLFDQERKLAQSGLGDLFDGVEIVSGKDAATYGRIFRQHGEGPDRALMVGNSMKSDILPALAAGAFAVHVPHDLTWVLEHAEAPVNHARFHHLDRLAGLPVLLDELNRS